MTKKILIVDDEPPLRLLVGNRLKANGYEIIEAKDGKDCIRTMIAQKPDLVVLDVLMPEMTGYQVVEHIKGLGTEIGETPFIIMSAKHTMENLFNAEDIYSFIPKPFDPQVLLSQVQELLGLADKVAEQPLAGEVQEASGERVLLVSPHEYILNKVKDFIEERGFTVVVTFDEKDTIEKAVQLRPAFVMAQFWDDPEVFNAVTIFKEFRDNPTLQDSKFVVFCVEGITIDACQDIPKEKVISFNESFDLIQRIGKYLTISK